MVDLATGAVDRLPDLPALSWDRLPVGSLPLSLGGATSGPLSVAPCMCSALLSCIRRVCDEREGRHIGCRTIIIFIDQHRNIIVCVLHLTLA